MSIHLEEMKNLPNVESANAKLRVLGANLDVMKKSGAEMAKSPLGGDQSLEDAKCRIVCIVEAMTGLDDGL